MRRVRALVFAGATLLAAALLEGCSTAPQKSAPPPGTSRVEPAKPSPDAPRRSPYAPAQEDIGKRGNYTRGGLYAPGVQDSVPTAIADVDQIPEPEVIDLPHSSYGNRSPYNVLGKAYTVRDSAHGYDETGLASYYGQKFHGRRTSNLEVYDMYAFTAAHRTLPLPSFARVTNLANGKSVIVRINDRGPFHDGRLIDLSFAAAVKLGVYPHGTARVQVHGLTAADVDSDQRVAANTVPVNPRALDDASATVPTPGGLAGGPSADTAGATTSAQSAPSPVRHPRESGEATTTASAKSDKDWRFDMRQDGRAMTADEFDAWMRARRARVATGRPQAMDARDDASPTPVATPGPRTPTPHALATSTTADAITLQIASFAARANAERALAMVTGAGIGNARLLDADANGRKVWRLRVGPVDATSAAELGQRLQGLGFGQPQRVRE
jgi:rare lipoprotein A